MTGLTYGTPEEAGMDPDRIARLRDRAPDWVDGHRMRSGVLLAARRGKIVFHEAYGPLTDQPGSPPLEKDSIFTTSSVGKVMTATAIVILAEEGRLGLNRPLKEYLPEVCGEGSDDIEVQHLLTHTSGYIDVEAMPKIQAAMAGVTDKTQLAKDPESGLHGTLALVLSQFWGLKSHWQPGSRMSYANANYLLLGEVVRRVSGQSLDQFSENQIFKPLGMKDTSCVSDPAKKTRKVDRGSSGAMGPPGGNPLVTQAMQDTPWGMGSFDMTALDLARFAQLFLDGGKCETSRILSPASVYEMSRNQIPGIHTIILDKSIEGSWGLGWTIQGADRWTWYSGTLTPEGTFYHSGAGGHFVWVDPANEIVGVYLSVCLDLDMHIYESHANSDLFQNMVTAAVAD